MKPEVFGTNGQSASQLAIRQQRNCEEGEERKDKIIKSQRTLKRIQMFDTMFPAQVKVMAPAPSPSRERHYSVLLHRDLMDVSPLAFTGGQFLSRRETCMRLQ
ncbi:hypothetical protein CEXT_794241 [Caerostris extrusa]|uniref:Uncharacterized protein n=1 Tax=Caerostris extrusa TaxID=172846 RepID=A0AAV4SQ08_CAEEX|nr:hypothetical protein CEXT_794241 [Caerostris extrusa]